MCTTYGTFVMPNRLMTVKRARDDVLSPPKDTRRTIGDPAE